jgi:hypothetical protein
MSFLRRRVLMVAAVMTLFAVGAPVAGAQVFPLPGGLGTTTGIGGQAGPQLCGSNAPAGTGYAGGTTAQSCGTALSFVGPAIGEIASTIGPTIIGAGVVGNAITVSSGPVGGPIGP